MTKKEIKLFFKAVAEGDFHKVAALIDTDIAYLTVCNFSPPKKDDGQSGLQIALKTGNFGIAELLIEKGADINFIESSTVNEWTAPVLHDAIRATIFNTYTLQKNTNHFDQAITVLQNMLVRKANPNSVDSYGNNSLHRTLMDAKQMINNPGADLTNNILLEQLRKVFSELIKAGADINLANDKRPSAVDVMVNLRLEQYKLW